MILGTPGPAPRRALTTVDRYRAAYPSLPRSDDQLELDIQAVSAAAEAWCGRVFARETVTELLEVAFLGDLILARAPVVGPIASLTLDGITIDVALLTVADPASGLLRPAAVPGALVVEMPGQLVGGQGWYGGGVGYGGGAGSPSYGYRSVRRRHQLVVAYTGGYVVPLPSGVTPPTGWETPNLPPDVERAIWIGVALAGQRVARVSDVVSEKFEDYSVTYGSGATRATGLLPDDARALLAPWARATLT